MTTTRQFLVGIIFILYSMCTVDLSLAQPQLPTTEQFHDALATCATGLTVTISTDLIGSITDIYNGQRSNGAANFTTATKFLELFPEVDRTKVYELYTKCISSILHIPPDNNSERKMFIYAQCQSKFLIEKPLQPGETLNVLQLWPTPEAVGGRGLMQMFMTKGNKFVWPTPRNGLPFLTGYQCDITNYRDGLVLNVELALEEVFREVHPVPNQPNAMQAGEITLSRKWPITIDKIDVGASNPFTFYIFNTSDTMVLISLPETVTFQIGAEDKMQTTRLVHSKAPMEFWPQSFQ